MNGQLAFPLTVQDTVTNFLTLGDAGALQTFLGIAPDLAQASVDAWTQAEDGFQELFAVGVDAELIRAEKTRLARFQVDTVRSLLYHSQKH